MNYIEGIGNCKAVFVAAFMTIAVLSLPVRVSAGVIPKDLPTIEARFLPFCDSPNEGEKKPRAAKAADSAGKEISQWLFHIIITANIYRT